MQLNQAIRKEAVELLSSATQRISNADLTNHNEWKNAYDSALNDMESVSSLLNLVNDPDAISGLHSMTKLSAWSELLWKNVDGWNRAIGYLVECSCGKGAYHLILTEPRKIIRCIKRDQVIVLKYLPNL